MKKLGAYIHIPFCEKKCYYCDFAAYPNLENHIRPYVENLIKEIRLYRKRMDVIIDTIYIGGGTPSYIDPSYIERIVGELKKFKTDLAEFTIESNPNSLDEDKLRLYKSLGINRISLGVQSFDNKVLKNIGRNHTRDIAIEDIRLIRAMGFDNLSFDLMLNLPGQSLESVRDDLKEVKALRPDHISWYSLILDKGSKFYALAKEGKLELMDDDKEVYIFDRIIGRLADLGLYRYEVSNFARPGYESVHNKKYWNGDGYIAFGLGASGYLTNNRYTNTRNLAVYDRHIRNNEFPLVDKEFISKAEAEKEYIIFKLRETSGINLKVFKDIFGQDLLYKYKDKIDKFYEDGFFIIDDHIRFTRKGMSLSNEFFIEII